MKSEDNLHHSSTLSSVTSGWQALGENVGVGPSVSGLHEAFMNSSSHRGNILGNFNYIGVGVVKESDSKMWVTAVFMRGPAGLVSPPDPPPAEDPPADESPAADPPADPPSEEVPPAPPTPKPTPTPVKATPAVPMSEAPIPAPIAGRLAPFAT